MPYGTPSSSTSTKKSQEKKDKSTFRNDADNKSIPTPDVNQNSSFIPLGVFSNQELLEVDLRNRTMNSRKRKKKFLIDQSSWKASRSDEIPWLTNNSVQQYKSVAQRLHDEIEEFVKYLCPTDIERLWRVFVIRRIEKCIKSCYPDAEIMVFGSFNTGLYLPTSDLDIVCFIKEDSTDILRKIAQLLDYNRVSHERPVTLTKAVVPIIKFREYYTKFNVDISFNQSSGYTSAREMKNYLDQWPSLGKMVILVKWFLKHHGLDDPSTGGMGGYTVFCMMLSFFQTHPLIRNGTLIPDDDNLGVLLIEFFELYGTKFNFLKVAIRINNGGEYVLKNSESWATKNPCTNICIQDPADSDNDIARSTRNTEIIFSHFEKAFRRLVVRVGSLERKYFSQNNNNEMIEDLNEESILSSIFFMPRKIIDSRRDLHRLYADRQKLANDYGSEQIIPPSFSHILYNFQYQIECADRLRVEKSNKLSYKNGSKIAIRSKKEYQDLAYKCRNEMDTYREFPYEQSTFLQVTYGETYKKVFAYSEVELDSKTKIKKRRKKDKSISTESLKDGQNAYKFEESSSSRRYEHHEGEVIYLEHDSDDYEDDYYIQPPASKRRKGNKQRN